MLGKDATHHAHAFLQDGARISHPVLRFLVLVGGKHGGHDEDVGHEVGKQHEEKQELETLENNDVYFQQRLDESRFLAESGEAQQLEQPENADDFDDPGVRVRTLHAAKSVTNIGGGKEAGRDLSRMISVKGMVPRTSRMNQPRR